MSSPVSGITTTVTTVLSGNGFFILVLVVFGLMLLVAILDLIQTVRKRPTVGDCVNRFVDHHRWLAALLAFLFGALIAHFFLHINDG